MVLASFKVQSVEQSHIPGGGTSSRCYQQVLDAQQHQCGPCRGGCEDKRRQAHSPLCFILLIWEGVLNYLSSSFIPFSKSAAGL